MPKEQILCFAFGTKDFECLKSCPIRRIMAGAYDETRTKIAKKSQIPIDNVFIGDKDAEEAINMAKQQYPDVAPLLAAKCVRLQS